MLYNNKEIYTYIFIFTSKIYAKRKKYSERCEAMLKRILSCLLAVSMILGLNTFSVFAEGEGTSSSPKKMEYLTRGAFGASIDGNIYLSWRLLGTEPANTTFNIYCNNKIIETGLNNTNYTHKGGNIYNKYQVAPVINGVEQSRSNDITILTGHKDSNYTNSPYAYFDVPIKAPNPNNCGYYEANDASVGDLDSDGEYEIILKWNPDNAKDNSQSGKTGNVYIDAYEMDGTLLWRIDLGRNIRAGAHYTQYIVYDFDGDGKAELATKTAPGSKDGQGNFVTEAGVSDEIKNADNTKQYGNSKGFILDGPEYLTIFDGLTGAAMQTILYNPNRTDEKFWGDKNASQGNRVDRMLAGVAYLDGIHPSLIMCRGYYARSVVVAYDWDGKNLKQKWILDSKSDKSNKFYGQGNHQISVADLDNDGFDEIIYGSAAIDHDGTLLHSTGWGHGDALHVSDFNNDGEQEIFSVLEDSPHWGTGFRKGTTKGDANILWKKTATFDVGRGLMTIMSEKHGALGWSSQGQKEVSGKKVYFAYNLKGEEIDFTSNSNGCSPNFAIYWDGDLLRELADGDRIIKWNDTTGGFDRMLTLSESNPVGTNNTSKKNPCLQADLFGDWREEIILRHYDNSALRIFASITPTDYKMPTLMHDSQYRCAIAWQNVAYNQPPHPSYYIGPTKTTYSQPNIEPVVKNKAVFTITANDGSPVKDAKITISNGTIIVTNSEGKAETPILPGTYKYSIKCVGFDAVGETEFTVNENDEITNVTNSMNAKTNCTVSVSFKTPDGKELKPSENHTGLTANTEFIVDEALKEDITDSDGKIYEYNPNLSSNSSFTVLDDEEVRLVFVEKTLPGIYGTEYYRTNFSNDGFSGLSNKHGYTAGTPLSSGITGGIKYSSYSIGGTSNDSITIDIPERIQGKFVAEFDMAYDTETGGGTIWGITPYSGTKTGPTLGVRLAGAGGGYKLNPAYYSDKNKTSYNGSVSVDTGKMYRHILECDGEKLYLTIADAQTGTMVVNKYEAMTNKDLTLGTDKIDKFTFNKVTGTGSINFNLGDFRVYSVSAPNNFEWENNSNINVSIPSQTNLAPKSYGFITGISSYKIAVDGNMTYSLTKADGTAVSDQDGVTIDENGLLTVSETPVKGDYKVVCKYNDVVIKEYTITVIKNEIVNIYTSTNDTTGELFSEYDNKYDDVKYSYSKGQWTFNQDGTAGGREFYGELYPTDSGEATLSFRFATGGEKDDAGNWDFTGREYNYELQLMDSSYNGEDPESHVILGFSQEYLAKAQEVQYYTKHRALTQVKNPLHFTGEYTTDDLKKNDITARSGTNWDVTVKFNFDKKTVSFDLFAKDMNAGYRYENIPTAGGFKGIRLVSSGDERIKWSPKISNIVYSKRAYEPSAINPDTIKLVPGKNSISVDFKAPNDGGSPMTYKVSLFNPDDESGKAVYEKETKTIPVVFENIPAGEYSYIVKIASNNLISSNDEVVSKPLNVTVTDDTPPIVEPSINITVEDDTLSEEGVLNFKAKVTAANIESQKGVVYAALYDADGNIISSNSDEKTLINGDNLSEFSLDTKNISNITLKVFLWDSAEGMKPLYNTNAFIKKINKV